MSFSYKSVNNQIQKFSKLLYYCTECKMYYAEFSYKSHVIQCKSLTWYKNFGLYSWYYLVTTYFPPSGRNGRNQQSGSNPNQILIQSEQKDIRGSKSNETSNFDKENDNAGDDNCCQSFSLNLTNEIKTKHSTREGSYILGSSIINGFKTWISSDGKTAIWYIKENLWCIGDVDNMSTSLCRLVRVSCQDLEVSASRQSFLGLGYLGREADIVLVTSIKWWSQW